VSLQSVMTTEDELSSLLNSAEEPILTVGDIVDSCGSTGLLEAVGG
jgi:hypothetical protein